MSGMSRLDLLEGAAFGAAAVYLLDPDRGRQRRRALAERAAWAAQAGYHAAIAEIRRRAGEEVGPRRLLAVLRSMRRGPGTAVSSWDLPMATVDIDIDQGTVTLRGLFQPAEENPVSEVYSRSLKGPSIHLVEDEA